MTPHTAMHRVVIPGLRMLDDMGLVPFSNDAAALCYAICGQESGWEHRVQVNGPARSYAQFESIAVRDVMQRATSKDRCRMLCHELNVDFDAQVIHTAMVQNDLLMLGMTRLNLWNQRGALPSPTLASQDAAWNYYVNTWKPGKPHPNRWGAHWQTGIRLLGAAT